MTKKKTDSTQIVSRSHPPKTSFPIVGIGASAGGLEAYESFFKTMPPDTGIAFVLISHLDPTHISILPELIKKQTQMEVVQADDGRRIEPNHIYVIPPNKELSILNGNLYLMELSMPRGHNMPIDNFFRSLAQDQGSNAICIILSGTGTDGTLGLKEIKATLGMVMVQEAESARYDGMPRSAIATGLVDYILPVEEMPTQLLKFTKHAIVQTSTILNTEADMFKKDLNKIFILLRSQTKHDFSHYKKNTICRRIERRMHVHQIDNVSDYVVYLQKNKEEVHTLFKDLLIGVTSFFRDKQAFDILKNNILIDLLRGKPDDYRIRIWIAGCSSGEEAYSIAILIQESMDRISRHFEVQIFGTDIDENAIAIARSGLYPLSISADISPERLKRYFIKEDNFFRVKPSIREMLVFAPQSLIKDPPFTKLDMISCRNLLIYFGPELQKKVLSIFHYSLKPDGVLFLGSSESIGQDADLFTMEDKKWKIFKRQVNPGVSLPVLNFPIPPRNEDNIPERMSETVKQATARDNLILVETILEQSDTPPCAIIDDQNNIVYIHGRLGRYLEPAIGNISVNILDMARPGLRAVLAAAIRKVSSQKHEIVQTNIEIQDASDVCLVDLMVKPLHEWGSMRGLKMVAFKDKAKIATGLSSKVSKKDKTIVKLELELQYTKENLQTTIEELETSNEELKSTNEELQSTNEELQSTNEELETSKEELQSLNEESATVNVELQSRIDDLSKTTDDMKNLLDSTQIATIFLDIDLCIRRFTPKVTELIPLSHTDIGRPINHFATELKDVKLTDYAEKVLKDLVIQEENVKSLDNRDFKIRVLPYRTTRNVIDGVVITFEDINDRKRIERALEERRVFLEAVLECTANGVMACDSNGCLTYFNNASKKFHGLPLKPIPVAQWTQYCDFFEADGKTPLKKENNPFLKILNSEKVLKEMCVMAPKDFPSRKVSVTGRLLLDSKGRKLGAVMSMDDLSGHE